MPAPRVRLPANGNGNGHTNGHAPAIPATIPAQQAEVNQIHRQLKALAVERAGHALAAVKGEPSALDEIKRIDAKRTALQAWLETREAAIRALHEQERAQEREDGWRKHVEPATRIYLGTLSEQRAIQTHRLGKLVNGGDLNHLALTVQGIENFAWDEARRVADNRIPHSYARTFVDGKDEHARHKAREADRQARQHAVAQLAQALFQAADHGLPFPPLLLEHLRHANYRLNQAGITAPRRTGQHLQALGIRS